MNNPSPQTLANAQVIVDLVGLDGTPMRDLPVRLSFMRHTLVRIQRQSETTKITAVSDSAGQVLAKDLEPGAYTITTSWERKERSLIGERTIRATIGAGRNRFSIPIPPQTVVTGQVFEPAGNKMSESTLLLFHNDLVDFTKMDGAMFFEIPLRIKRLPICVPDAIVDTDAKGDFMMKTSPHGVYRVVAEHKLFTSVLGPLKEFGSGADIHVNERLVLRDKWPGRGSIRIQLVDQLGKPLVGQKAAVGFSRLPFTVDAKMKKDPLWGLFAMPYWSNQSYWTEVISDQDGWVAVNDIRPSAFQFGVKVNDAWPITRFTTTLEPGQPRIVERVSVGPGGWIDVKQTGPGSTASGIRWKALSLSDPWTKDLVPLIEKNPYELEAIVDISSDGWAWGTEHLGPLQPGSYAVLGVHPDGQIVITPAVEVTAEATVTTAEVSWPEVARSATASATTTMAALTIVVRDAAGVALADASVHVFPVGQFAYAAAPAKSIVQLRTDQQGRCTFDAISSGKIEIVVSKAGYVTPPFVTCELSPAAAGQAQVMLAPACIIDGSVTLPAGSDPGRVLVQLIEHDVQRRTAQRSTDVDPQGRFVFRDVPPGTYQLRAEAYGLVPPGVTTVEVTADRRASVALDLAAPVQMRLLVGQAYAGRKIISGPSGDVLNESLACETGWIDVNGQFVLQAFPGRLYDVKIQPRVQRPDWPYHRAGSALTSPLITKLGAPKAYANPTKVSKIAVPEGTGTVSGRVDLATFCADPNHDGTWLELRLIGDKAVSTLRVRPERSDVIAARSRRAIVFASGETSAQGRAARFTDLPPGRYRLEASIGYACVTADGSYVTRSSPIAHLADSINVEANRPVDLGLLKPGIPLTITQALRDEISRGHVLRECFAHDVRNGVVIERQP
ncbi:MAG: carboxypeptidase-like regulatory domain-containing protein [Planctomycetota bacterium]